MKKPKYPYRIAILMALLTIPPIGATQLGWYLFDRQTGYDYGMIVGTFSVIYAAWLMYEKNWRDAARGILTTDTRPKLLSKQVKLADSLVTITGFAKGSGMIRPNMATMLSFVFTDALIEKELLDEMISELVDESFNRITVDGDTQQMMLQCSWQRVNLEYQLPSWMIQIRGNSLHA